jgi:IrrE N-terminal-like domain
VAGAEAGFPRARAAARRLLYEAGVTAPEHIDVEAIARAQGAEIVHGPLAGAPARVMRIGARARIRVSDRIAHPGVERFSIAHELGHLVLGHELPPAPDSLDAMVYLARACQRRARGGVDPDA